MQQIFGVDFTSAPRASKPIRVAACQAGDSGVHLERFLSLTSVTDFQRFLETSGPWQAALDFPFGQPRRLLQALGWPLRWSRYVQTVSELSAGEWATLLDEYRAGQPAGDKHHLRVTDRLQGAQSPMMLHGVPVAKMFRVGAPCLLHAPISVLPCRPAPSNRVAVEAYPALVARHVLGRKPYKHATRRRGAALQSQRETLLAACEAGTALSGIRLHVDPNQREQILQDASGDSLDALLCACQLAAAQQTFGRDLLPPQADAVEGWILAHPAA